MTQGGLLGHGGESSIFIRLEVLILVADLNGSNFDAWHWQGPYHNVGIAA